MDAGPGPARRPAAQLQVPIAKPQPPDVARIIREQRLCLYRQAIVPLAGGAPGWHELLLRVRADAGPPQASTELIAAAEQCHMMQLVDRQVIHLALSGLAQGAGASLLSINISGLSLCDVSFAHFVRREFHAAGVRTEQICFEVTETAAISDLRKAQDTVAELRGLGCALALDNFGGSSSSPSHLNWLPADYLKFDGRLVRDLITDSVDCATLETVNRLAHLKGMRTVAESVEDQETCERLRALGVDYAQGCLFERPAPWPSDRLSPAR